MPGKSEESADPDGDSECQQHDRDHSENWNPPEAQDIDQAELEAEKNDRDSHKPLRCQRKARSERTAEESGGCRNLSDGNAEGNGSGEQWNRREHGVNPPADQPRGGRGGYARQPRCAPQ